MKRTERHPLLLSEQESKAIDEYRWEKRLLSFNEAARQLIAKGLQPEKPERAFLDEKSAGS